MKKYYLSTALFLCLFNRASAQLAYGFEAGIGESTMAFAPAAGFTNASQTPITSWKFGQLADIRLNDHIFLQTGGAIVHKGQSRKFSFYSSDTLNAAEDQTLSLLYGEVPLNVVFKTGQIDRERFFFGIGANFTYLIGGTNKFHYYGRYGKISFDSTANNRAQGDDPVKGFDLGINLYGGYELPSGLLFKLYYTASFTDIGLGTETDKNRYWGFGVGYLFGKKKAIRHQTEDVIDYSNDE